MIKAALHLFFRSSLATTLIVATLCVTQAQVRTSPNYQLQSDSINVGGGLATSTNYVQESTVGEIATGRANSSNYSLRAGYQQMQEVFISLTLSSSSITMVGTLGGLTGGESNGSSTVSVLTDSSGGYQLSIAAVATPALRKNPDTIADYVANSAPNPDFIFTTDSGEAHFGFAPFGNDVTSRFKNNGSACNAGGTTITALRCWQGLSTSAQVIASGAGANQPAGADTTIQFKVGIASGAGVVSGTYVATTTLTAIAL